MKRLRFVAVVVASTGLAGCFVSDPPFLDDANSVAPYESIVFRESTSDEPSRLERQGKTYVAADSDDEVILRFKPLDKPDWYVVQVSGESDGDVVHLYALVKVDIPNGVAETYAAVAADEIGNGMQKCRDYMICVDAIDDYIGYAEGVVAGGAEPVSTYEITVE